MKGVNSSETTITAQDM